MYELTAHEKAVIDGQAGTFWQDLKVTTYKNAVILYVTSHRSNFDYVSCLGVYDSPEAAQEVLEAVLVHPGYVNRSPVSASGIVGGIVEDAIGATGAAKYYRLEDDSRKAQRCEDEIAYWREQQVQP